jgi:hypothetical protein
LSYFCCISKVIFRSTLQQPNLSSFRIEIKHEKETEVLNCIANFLNFLSGNTFLFERFSPEVFFLVVDKLEIVGFEDILLQLCPIPSQFQEAESFLQFKFATSLQTHYQKSIEIVSSKFFEYNIENPPPFSLSVLESILFSSKLKIMNETILLQIIFEKIKIDSNYKTLLKHVHFGFVKSDILISFFSEVELMDLDLSVFQEIKKGLIELKLPISQELTKRWKETPNILPENEMKEIIEIVGDICESKDNISQQLKGIVSQHKFYEEQILSQNQEIKLLRKKFTNNPNNLLIK